MTVIDRISSDLDQPVFPATSKATFDIFQPNDATTCRSPAISPGGVYRKSCSPMSASHSRLSERSSVLPIENEACASDALRVEAPPLW
jgi:hypothetical protein